MQSMSDEPLPPSAQQGAPQSRKPSMLFNKMAWAAEKIAVRAMWRQWGKPLSTEEQEKLVEDLRKVGLTDAQLSFTLLVIAVIGEALRDQEEVHRLDRYVVGGCAILDLVLFQILASSTPDAAIHVSWIAFAISLSCTMGSLFFSFLRDKPKRYGKPHSVLSAFAIYSTITLVTALIWHFWTSAGIVFLIASLIIAPLCLGYAAILAIRKHWPQEHQPSSIEQEIIYD